MRLIGKVVIVVLIPVFLFVSYSIIVYKYNKKSVNRSAEAGAEKKTGKIRTVRKYTFSSRSDLDKWEVKKLAKNSTDYTLTREDGRGSVKAVSENSASALFLKKRFSTDKDPVVSWYWKAETFPSRKGKENLNDKKEFDFVAQVYVIFHAKFFLNTKAIQYVWTEDLPVGTIDTSPYTGNVKLMVLESGPSEEWKYEERDVAEDFRKLFGENLEKDIEAISFMTDADSTATRAVAYFSDFALGYRDEMIEKSGEDNGMYDVYKKAYGKKWYNWVENIPWIGEYIRNS